MKIGSNILDDNYEAARELGEKTTRSMLPLSICLEGSNNFWKKEIIPGQCKTSADQLKTCVYISMNRILLRFFVTS